MLALSALALSLGCGSADPNLFGSGPPPPQASGGSSAGSASNAGSSGLLVSSGSGGEDVAGTAGSGGSAAGCAFSCGEGGRRGNSAGSGPGGLGGQGAEAGSRSDPECAAFGSGATFLPSTQHCYVVDIEPRTFAAAQEYCRTLNAHLVTLGDEAEDDFAWSIHDDEHWIGAKDGKKPGQSGVGTYSWLTNEPFDYRNWSSNQPNASESGCVEGSEDSACYEHCAFQWKGGEHDGQWNDRYCMHTIASICEWDGAP